MRVSRFYQRFVVLAGFAVVAIVLALDALHALHGLTLSSVDARFAIRGRQRPPSDVVVVGIDADTFNHLDAQDAHFPFARHLDALVIANLTRAGAKVIAFDMQFTEATDPGDDAALASAVRSAGNVVLATTEVGPGGTTDIFGGGQALALSRGTPGEAQFPTDSDGTIRRMRDQILGLTTFPVAAASKALSRPITFPGGPSATALIDYSGPSGTVPTLSFWQVLDGRFPSAAVRGKVVVIGATEPVLQDVHRTPTDVQMAGPEIQANAIDSVLRGFPLRDAPQWVDISLVIVFGFAAPLLALRFNPLLAGGLALVGVALLAVAGQLAFNNGTVVDLVYPTLAALLAVAATLVLQGVRVAFERELIRDTFARFVPESVVSQVLAQADGARLGGVRREATVLFSDLRGFTTFAEQREPAETIDILNRHLTEVSEAVLEYGGTIVSYLGDGVMAVFGAPIEQSDHAQRALGAVRALLVRHERFNDWLRSQGYDGFKIGVGLNSGPVMSGNVGSERRLEYTTIGDTTNTASRIQGMTKGTPHELFISGTTYALLTDPSPDLV